MLVPKYVILITLFNIICAAAKLQYWCSKNDYKVSFNRTIFCYFDLTMFLPVLLFDVVYLIEMKLVLDRVCVCVFAWP